MGAFSQKLKIRCLLVLGLGAAPQEACCTDADDERVGKFRAPPGAVFDGDTKEATVYENKKKEGVYDDTAVTTKTGDDGFEGVVGGEQRPQQAAIIGSGGESSREAAADIGHESNAENSNNLARGGPAAPLVGEGGTAAATAPGSATNTEEIKVASDADRAGSRAEDAPRNAEREKAPAQNVDLAALRREMAQIAGDNIAGESGDDELLVIPRRVLENLDAIDDGDSDLASLFPNLAELRAYRDLQNRERGHHNGGAHRHAASENRRGVNAGKQTKAGGASASGAAARADGTQGGGQRGGEAASGGKNHSQAATRGSADAENRDDTHKKKRKNRDDAENSDHAHHHDGGYHDRDFALDGDTSPGEAGRGPRARGRDGVRPRTGPGRRR
eukprot:gene240-277_t